MHCADEAQETSQDFFFFFLLLPMAKLEFSVKEEGDTQLKLDCFKNN